MIFKKICRNGMIFGYSLNVNKPRAITLRVYSTHRFENEGFCKRNILINSDILLVIAARPILEEKNTNFLLFQDKKKACIMPMLLHRVRATFFYPSLIATQKEVKYGLKKMRRNSLYVPDTVTVFTVEVRSAIIISCKLTCTLYL